MKILFLILCVFIYAPQPEITTEYLAQLWETELRDQKKLGPNQHLSALAVRRLEDKLIARLMAKGAKFNT